MIEGIVKKIMFTGINKYSKILETSPENIQIRITDNKEGIVNYEICKEFKINQKVSFLNIMDKKIDIFKYENITSPFIKNSLIEYANETNDDVENVSVFILKHNDTIGLSFFNSFKNGKNITLSKFLEKVSL